MLDLFFAGAPIACNRLFKLQGGVFIHLRAARDQRANGRAARLAQQQCCAWIHIDEYLFDSSVRGSVFGQQRLNAFKMTPSRWGRPASGVLMTPLAMWRSGPPLRSIMPKPVRLRPGSMPMIFNAAACRSVWL